MEINLTIGIDKLWLRIYNGHMLKRLFKIYLKII